MTSRLLSISISAAAFLFSCSATLAQGNAAPAPRTTSAPAVTADYPHDSAGIFIQGSGWIAIESERPAKSHIKHCFAPALTYGAVPAAIVSDYKGAHAKVHIHQARPIICVCRFFSLPGDPVLVRLHRKKHARELDGGRLRIGAKMEEARKSNLVPINVSKPDDMVWLIQPQQPLPPGEYALMLGTQNILIYPFTIAHGNAAAPTGNR